MPNDSPYAPRDVLAAEDARTLARELLGVTQAARQTRSIFVGSGPGRRSTSAPASSRPSFTSPLE
jgi:hypothetical protein